MSKLIILLLGIHWLSCYLAYRRGYRNGFDVGYTTKLYQVRKLENIKLREKRDVQAD